MLQEELEDWALRTNMRFSFAWTQKSFHLPSLINSVLIPFSLGLSILPYSVVMIIIASIIHE